MATASTISVSSGVSSIRFNVVSEPSNPIIRLTSNQDWVQTLVTQNSSTISILENDTPQVRSANISISANTTADTNYNGTASATSSYTITQEAGNVNKEVILNLPNVIVNNHRATVPFFIQFTIDPLDVLIGDSTIASISQSISSEGAQFYDWDGQKILKFTPAHNEGLTITLNIRVGFNASVRVNSSMFTGDGIGTLELYGYIDSPVPQIIDIEPLSIDIFDSI